MNAMDAARARLKIAPDLAAGGVAVLVAFAALPGPARLDPAAMAITVLVYLGIAAAVVRAWPPDRREFGWPNRVTLARAALVAVLAGHLAGPGSIAEHGLVLASVACLALLLDGLDGWLARWLDRATRFGARFDMEIDALLILVLSLAVWLSGKVGPWVLAIGLMRYAFVAAGHLLPHLAAPLRPSRMRKIVCVVQGAVLAACLVPAMPADTARLLLAAALSALTVSFILDTLELTHRSPTEGNPS